MGKSGLFSDYLIKSAQVITWFSLDPSSGFTFWPDGPLKAPQRLDVGPLIANVERLLPDAADRRRLWWDTPRRWLGFDAVP